MLTRYTREELQLVAYIHGAIWTIQHLRGNSPSAHKLHELAGSLTLIKTDKFLSWEELNPGLSD